MADGIHKLTMRELQQQYGTLYGTGKSIIWDLYNSSEKNAVINKLKCLMPDDEGDVNEVEKIVQNCFKGPNDQKTLEKKLKEYDAKLAKKNAKIAECRNTIVNAIWAQRKYCNKDLLMSIIFVLVAPSDPLLLNDGICSRKYSCHPVFRIRKCKLNDDSQMCCMIFVDENGRVYQDWDDYTSNNVLPKGVMCFPKHGIYTFDWENKVELQKSYTPACSVTEAALKATDKGVIVLGVTAAIAPVAAIFMPVAAPFIIYSAVTGAASSLWSIGRSSAHLADRGFHEQSINLTDRQARFSWLSIIGGALGLGSSGATQGLLFHAATGAEVNVAARIAVNSVNAISVTVNGLSVGNGIIEIIMKAKDDEPISALDIVQFSTSLVLLTHSVYNFHYVSNIINNIKGESTIQQLRNMLGESQREIFDKFVKQTQRLTSGLQNKMDIIRVTGSIPDYKPSNCAVEEFGGFGNANLIHVASLACRITSTVTRVINGANLENCLYNMLDILKEAAIRMIIDITKSFFQEFGDALETHLRRVIPFEEVLWKCFNIAREFIGPEKITIEALALKSKDITKKLKDYYEASQTTSFGTNIKCKKCRGYYSIAPC